MKRNAWIAAIAAGLFSAAALAQMGPGGQGPGGRGPLMGPGTGSGGCGMQAEALETLGLTPEQRSRIATIMDETATQRLTLMDEMHDLRSDGVRSGNPDRVAMASVRERMLALARERRDRIDAVLTPEQRTRLRSGGRGFGPFG